MGRGQAQLRARLGDRGPGGPSTVEAALAPRWRGQPGRLEVWYATLSDPRTGTGFWVHHEVVAPVRGEPYVDGWAAIFPAGAAPVVERFDRRPLPGWAEGDTPRLQWPDTADAVVSPPAMRGAHGRLAWDLRWNQPADVRSTPGAGPLFTFPRWAWEREVLPAAQIVPVASAAFTGTLHLDGVGSDLSELAAGNVAHIYGHGSAQRWGWLHADLGDGDVLELVTAVSRRPGLDRLPPLAFVQLRAGGRDWPRDPLLAAPLLRTTLGLPSWQVHGRVGRWRLHVEVTLPPERSVEIGYVDPDGSTATCTNSETADAQIVLERRRSGWEKVSAWTLHGRAHAEVGTRP